MSLNEDSFVLCFNVCINYVHSDGADEKGIGTKIENLGK